MAFAKLAGTSTSLPAALLLGLLVILVQSQHMPPWWGCCSCVLHEMKPAATKGNRMRSVPGGNESV